METLKKSPNNGYYLCKDSGGNFRILSTNYLARRIGVKPKNTKNELKNWITDVYPIPFKMRSEAVKSIESIPKGNWIDVTKVPALYVRKHGRHCPTRFFIYFYFESLIMDSLDMSIASEEIEGMLLMMRISFMKSNFDKGILTIMNKLRSVLLPQGEDFINRLFYIISTKEYLHPKSEHYRFLFPEKYNRKL